MKNAILLVVASFLLAGCAVPLTSQEMLPQFDFYDDLKPQKFEDNISIRNVEVAKGVGGMFPVTPAEYKGALVSSFRQADLYNTPDDALYYLDAYMVEMNQPMLGFNMTVEVTADYTVYRNDSVVYQEQLSLPCTKGIQDAFDGTVRLRLASGCAVGENITHLIKILSAQ